MSSKIIKVLLAIGYSKEFGGAQKVFITYIKDFLKKGCEVVAVIPEGPLVDLIKPLNVKTYVIGNLSISSCVTVARILSREKVDIINTHLPKCGLQFSAVNLFYKKPICCTFHNAIIHCNTGKVKKAIYPYLYSLLAKMCNGFIVNSRNCRNHFHEIAGVDEDFMEVIYFGVDQNKFKYLSEQKNNTSKCIIGTVGRLSREKGHRYLIEALARLKDIDFECLIIGDGPEKDDLENLAKTSNLERKIKFLGFKENVEDYVKEMDMVIIPSLEEAFGVAIVEAFVMKKLVIASDVGGIPELVQHGVTGLLFSAKDSMMLSERIRYACENKEEGKKLAQQAYDFAIQNLYSTATAEKTLAYYEFLQSKVGTRAYAENN